MTRDAEAPDRVTAAAWAEARLTALQRDEALATLAAVRQELTTALREHREHESRLAEEIREAQRQLMDARDRIHHMERSLFWRLRTALRRRSR